MDTHFDLVRANGGAAAFAATAVFDLVFRAGGLLVAVGAAVDDHCLARSLRADFGRDVNGLCCVWLLPCAGLSAGTLETGCSGVVAGTLGDGYSSVVADTLGAGFCSLIIERVCILVVCCTLGAGGAAALAC